MYYDICVEFQWLLQYWVVEIVVDDEQCVCGFCDFVDCFDVGEFGQWV